MIRSKSTGSMRRLQATHIENSINFLEHFSMFFSLQTASKVGRFFLKSESGFDRNSWLRVIARSVALIKSEISKFLSCKRKRKKGIKWRKIFFQIPTTQICLSSKRLTIMIAIKQLTIFEQHLKQKLLWWFTLKMKWSSYKCFNTFY